MDVKPDTAQSRILQQLGFFRIGDGFSRTLECDGFRTWAQIVPSEKGGYDLALVNTAEPPEEILVGAVSGADFPTALALAVAAANAVIQAAGWQADPSLTFDDGAGTAIHDPFSDPRN